MLKNHLCFESVLNHPLCYDYDERRFSIYKQKVLERVHYIFYFANIPYELCEWK